MMQLFLHSRGREYLKVKTAPRREQAAGPFDGGWRFGTVSAIRTGTTENKGQFQCPCRNRRPAVEPSLIRDCLSPCGVSANEDL